MTDFKVGDVVVSIRSIYEEYNGCNGCTIPEGTKGIVVALIDLNPMSGDIVSHLSPHLDVRFIGFEDDMICCGLDAVAKLDGTN